MSDLKERFDELMWAVDLLPEPTKDSEGEFTPAPDEFLLPNSTQSLDRPELFGAIMCHALKRDDDFRMKLATTLTATAVVSVNHKTHNDEKPNESDLGALSLAVNLLWATGSFYGVAHTLNMISDLCDHFDLEVPNGAVMILRPNEGAKKFGELDPYRILDKDYDLDDIMKLKNSDYDE